MLFCIHQPNSPRIIFEKTFSIVSILTESTALYLLSDFLFNSIFSEGKRNTLKNPLTALNKKCSNNSKAIVSKSD
ncbi:hypothetical protein EFT54_10000 [Lacticaseibacillus paracasei]|nr:hypothetical protein [Lacticaseibacillus paracasei]RDG20597.1 hypothetical protein DQM17_12595 [Lacticaseibacillus paracasei]